MPEPARASGLRHADGFSGFLAPDSGGNLLPDAYDNAMAESFFATLECELIERRSFRSKAEAKAAVFSDIEGWYNPRRGHSVPGDHSSVEFERRVVAEVCQAAEINEKDQIPA